jgi:hypothetical protein
MLETRPREDRSASVNAVPSVTLDISRSCNRAISNSALEYSQTPYCSSLSDLTDRLDSNAMPIVKSIFQSLNKRFQIEILDRNTQGLTGSSCGLFMSANSRVGLPSVPLDLFRFAEPRS